MLILRIIGVLTIIAIGAGVFAFLISGQRRYLRYALFIAKYALMATFAILALLLLERFIVI